MGSFLASTGDYFLVGCMYWPKALALVLALALGPTLVLVRALAGADPKQHNFEGGQASTFCTIKNNVQH